MRIRIFSLALMLGNLSIAGAQAAPSPAELEQAGNLFAITCSSSFCHGEAGIGGRGPTLRDRNFPADYVRSTMLQGRSGTAMPAFKDSLSGPEIDLIVSYVMSLSPNNHATTTHAAAPIPPSAPAAPLGPQAQLGSAIFYDVSRPSGCALCHSYGQRGGPVGPDLTSIAKKSPRDIYLSMVKPAVDPAYSAIAVTTADGKALAGIMQSQDQAAVRLYDLSSMPPVLRSFYFADGNRVDTAKPEAPYVHDLRGLSNEQVADLIAFLKSAASGALKPVTPQDFAEKEGKK